MRKQAKQYRSNNAERTLALIDVENCIGQGHLVKPLTDKLRKKLDRFKATDGYYDFVIGTSHRFNEFIAMQTWGNQAHHVCIEGHNGADLALIQYAKDNLADGYTKCVIFSADGIFAEVVELAKSLGIPVEAHSGKHPMSHKLVEALG